MAFLDNLSEMISGKGKEAADAAKKVAEIANVKGRINGVETEIKKNYLKLGEAYYEAYKNAEVTCEFEEYVQTIRDAKNAVEELNRKLNELKGDVVCSSCGASVKLGSAFCSNCGSKIETEYFDEEDHTEDADVVEVEEAAEHEVVETETILEEENDEVEELEEIVE